MYDKVSFRKADTYAQEEIDIAVAGLLRDIDFDSLMKNAKKVVIKPNLVIKRPPEAYTTTHPAILSAVLKILGNYDAQVIIAESPGGLFNEQVLKGLYKTTGTAGAAEGSNAELNYDLTAVDIPSVRHTAVTEFNVLKPFAQADLIINLAKLKTHSLTVLSGAVKNMYGAIPGLQKFELHARFPEPERFAAMVVELTQTLHPQVNIVDGVYGMEGNGPNNGTTRFYGALFASRSPFCCDVVCADYLGLPRGSVEMLNESVRLGLCPSDMSEIELSGDKNEYNSGRIRNIKLPDTQNGSVITRLSRFAGGRVTRFFEPRPVVTDKCRGCGECVMYCPAKTIKLVDKKAVIDREKCIKCFCCQELCKVNAIKIHRVGILKL